MNVSVCKRHKFRTCLPKYGGVFLFLTVFVSFLVLYKMDILELRTWFEVKCQNQVNSSIIISKVSTDPPIHHSFCTFKPLSAEEALEEQLLLDSIAWPETPPLKSPLSLEETSDPAHSTFTILPKKGGGPWHVGDELEVMIKMYDFKGRPKKSGGDVLLTRLHNLTLGAGVAGQVVDHFNGSYSAVLSLLWEGSAHVEVTLVHPSEAVTVLRRVNSEQPDRIDFKSVYRSGSVTETTTCNLCLRPTQQQLCNYTDLHTGEPWFCYKPEKLGCDARISHAVRGFKQNLLAQEKNLFQTGVNMKVFIPASGPANVTVLPKQKDQPKVKSRSVKSGPSGYYYQGAWRSLDGTTVHQFDTPLVISQCLKGKMVHLYGDSTIRQWYEYLTATLPDLKEFNLHNPRKNGPFMALDYTNNILVTYRCHGPPYRVENIQTTELRYVANELDGVTGGSNTVVVFSVWAHFSTFPIQVYIWRLQSIRRAVVRLLARAPDTLVVIRTANLKFLQVSSVLTNSDWYSLQRDKVLRAMFKGLNVHLVDAWEMTVAHHLRHNIHPPPPIIKNMLAVLLSYICPQKDG